MKAAQLLQEVPIAVDLVRMENAGEMLGDGKACFFFGANSSQTQSLLSNPQVVRA